MKNTPKLKLNKPDGVDYVRVEVLNENMDILDADLGHLKGSQAYSQAEKDKLAGAVNYTHPSSHSADMITDGTNKVSMTKIERDKLAGIETGANKYTHPATHPASIITQDPARRFVSDTEKAKWNNCPDIANPIEIPISSDLNSYTKGGWFKCASTANAKTLSNLPELKESFNMQVIPGETVRQVWRHSHSERTFERALSGGAWTAWKEVAFKGNLTKTDVGLSNVDNVKQASAIDLANHIKAPLPHEGTRSDGSRYKWGFKSEGGSLIYMEEDI